MQRSLKKLLWDADHAASLAISAASSHTIDDYLIDEFFRGGLHHQLQVVGEALRRASELDPTLAVSIPDLPKIIGLRHRIVHDYDDINSALVWSIIADHLPLLRRQLAALLSE